VHLTRLALTDFRSYASADLTLEAGVTTLIGPNGEGKTNLAEAIGYVATLGSHRVATDTPLVRQGAERAIVRSAIASGRGNALIEIEINPGRANRVRLNRTPLPRAREILGVLRTVLFAPEDLSLVKGDPGERRRFLDDLLVATAPRYAAVRSDYERIVRQRTALLKSAGARVSRGGRVAASSVSTASAAAPSGGPPSARSGTGSAASAIAATLDAWDDQLARVGTELVAGRLSLVRALRPHVEAAYAAVQPGARAEAIDAAAREPITAAGYGAAFIHRTGHGIGLESHEDPYIVAGNAEPLSPGMAFSIEPGIYPGPNGARIEDIVVCTENGAERLNNVTRDLILVDAG